MVTARVLRTGFGEAEIAVPLNPCTTVDGAPPSGLLRLRAAEGPL